MSRQLHSTILQLFEAFPSVQLPKKFKGSSCPRRQVVAAFPLVQLPKKFKVDGEQMTIVEPVSISSTSEEVQSTMHVSVIYFQLFCFH